MEERERRKKDLLCNAEGTEAFHLSYFAFKDRNVLRRFNVSLLYLTSVRREPTTTGSLFFLFL